MLPCVWTFAMIMCLKPLSAANTALPQSQAIAEPREARVQCNTAPLCLYEARPLSHPCPVILIPSNVSLSKTVTQSLPRSLSLSICQSAVSHSLIQSVPRLPSPSVSHSFSHSIPLSLFAHLTSPPHSLTCTFPLSIMVHVLVARF